MKIKGFEYKCICSWSKDNEFGFIPDVGCPAHGEQAKKLLKGGVEYKPTDNKNKEK